MKCLLYLVFPLLFSNAVLAQKVAVYDNYTALEKEVLNDESSLMLSIFGPLGVRLA